MLPLDRPGFHIQSSHVHVIIHVDSTLDNLVRGEKINLHVHVIMHTYMYVKRTGPHVPSLEKWYSG